MADPNILVPLPDSVQQLLERLCAQHHLPPLDFNTRRTLASLGEHNSLFILECISPSPSVRSLSGFIHHLIRQHFPTEAHNSNSHQMETHSVSNKGFSSSPSSFTKFQGSSAVRRQNCTNMTEEGVEPQTSSAVLKALGELEFRKAFLLLNYKGKERLENVITSSQIDLWKALPMDKFESRIWEEIGQKIIDPEDRVKSDEWESGKTHVYHCHVCTDWSLKFKGPYLENTRTHLQKSLGDDSVLMVKFSEDIKEDSLEKSNDYLSKLKREGITVGLRVYKFLVFKDGGKKEKKKDPMKSSVKCYFLHLKSTALVDERETYPLSYKTVREARSLFMHVHTVPNISTFMSRFSLVLSKTLTMDIDLATVNVDVIEDTFCLDECGNRVYDNDKPRIHTDGTGFISEDLALLCPRNVVKGEHSGNNGKTKFLDMMIVSNPPQTGFNMQDPPLLIQCRLYYNGYAIKGTLLLNKKLPPKTLQVRQSMIKVEKDPSLLYVNTINSLEIVQTSNQPKKTYLSRNLIALLNYGGVSNEYFMNILEKALEDACGVFTNYKAALRVSFRHGELDDFNVAEMISCGIPLDETYIQSHLSILAREERKNLKAGKLHIPECYYLMGTADPTGCLEKNQICVILDNGQISGDVLVYRNPGLHFGDIHVLRATYIKELESYVGNSKYGIFFPVDGPRSLGDEIAGGDFDGDMYFVSRNAQLLGQFRVSEPWIPDLSGHLNSVKPKNVKSPHHLSDEELENELFELFLTTRFQRSYAVGKAADSWLALMDRLLTLGDDCKEEKECVKRSVLQLIDIYYEALDAPKKGGTKVQIPKHLVAELFPHYMEKGSSYTSKSILGLIYDRVSSYEDRQEGTKDVRKLPCFDVEIPQSYYQKWRPLYDQYKKEMAAALNLDPLVKGKEADGVIKKYKQILYNAAELKGSTKDIGGLHYEALAIYHITYDCAKQWNDVGKCRFAWKVAGPALADYHVYQQGRRTRAFDPHVLREILG